MKTVNLELSKQLKEAGYPQEQTHFVWSTNIALPKDIHLRTHEWVKTHNPYHQIKNSGVIRFFASPTADEILEQLPKDIKIFPSEMAKDGWTVGYETINTLYTSETDYSLADAAAKMWLYLKKEGLL